MLLQFMRLEASWEKTQIPKLLGVKKKKQTGADHLSFREVCVRVILLSVVLKLQTT